MAKIDFSIHFVPYNHLLQLISQPQLSASAFPVHTGLRTNGDIIEFGAKPVHSLLSRFPVFRQICYLLSPCRSKKFRSLSIRISSTTDMLNCYKFHYQEHK